MQGRPPQTVAGEPVQLAVGDVLARKYRLIEPLGEGGMAVVWVAQNIALETRVAVKILRASLANDARLVARIRQEAKATAAIAHKNIVQVFDYGVTSWGAPFIVMELLRGETLAERLQARGALPAVEAVRVLAKVMKGVTIAHAKGVVHRDLKPENIFLAIEDNGVERPKVLDFGVSFVSRRADERLTRAGGIVGTPSYMAPESIEGEGRGDVRGDVWSLGVMLHEMLAGELPFRGRNVHVLLETIVHEPARRLVGVVEGVDERLQAIVDRALEKDPLRRYPGAREMFDDLEAWLGETGGRGSMRPAGPGEAAVAHVPSGGRFFDDDEGPTLVGPSLDPSAHAPSPLRVAKREGERRGGGAAVAEGRAEGASGGTPGAGGAGAGGLGAVTAAGRPVWVRRGALVAVVVVVGLLMSMLGVLVGVRWGARQAAQAGAGASAAPSSSSR